MPVTISGMNEKTATQLTAPANAFVEVAISGDTSQSYKMSLDTISKKAGLTTVSNVTALFARTDSLDNQLFQTLGYTTEGIGANLYWYDSGSAATIDGGFTLPGIGGALSFSGTTFNGTAGTGRFIAVEQSIADVTKFGAVHDGTTNDWGSIQRAINTAGGLASRPTVHMPGGKYKTTSTLTVTQNSVSIVGLSAPSFFRGTDSGGGYATLGATIRYSGTGIALLVGVSPGSNRTFIENTRIEHLRIEVDNNTSIGMRVWHSFHGQFSDLVIFGMKGSTNIGLQVEAGVNNIYDRIEVAGIGQTVGAGVADYAIGLRAKLGYLNDQATTTTFRKCYFHYCYQAAVLDYAFNFEDCVFEASGTGMTTTSSIFGSFTRCWFEANVDTDAFFGVGSKVHFVDCSLNSYARQAYFTGSGATSISFAGCKFSSTHVSPMLFASSSAPTIDNLEFSGCTFPADMVFGSTAFTNSSNTSVSSMQVQTYRFIETGVTGTMTIAAMNSENGREAYRIPKDGHIVALRVYASGALGGGTWDMATKLNASTVTNVSYPAVPISSSASHEVNGHHFGSFVSAGDSLNIYFHTSSIVNTVDFIVEVDVALGVDGRE
jgi:hypothetical protein